MTGSKKDLKRTEGERRFVRSLRRLEADQTVYKRCIKTFNGASGVAHSHGVEILRRQATLLSFYNQLLTLRTRKHSTS